MICADPPKARGSQPNSRLSARPNKCYVGDTAKHVGVN